VLGYTLALSVVRVVVRSNPSAAGDPARLRERKEDIPFLAQHFVTKLGPDTGNRVHDVTDAGIAKLMSYHWPGNVRELENVIERSLVMCSGERLDAADIKLEMAPRSRAQADQADRFLPDGLTLDQYEQDLIREALRRADGNKSQAARLLGLTRNALRYRLTQIRTGFRGAAPGRQDVGA